MNDIDGMREFEDSEFEGGESTDANDGPDALDATDASRLESVKTAKYTEQWWEPRNNVGRCNGHRRNGNRCLKPAIRGATVCRTHGGATRHVRAKARQRLEEAADRMARELLKMATDEDVSDATKLAAIRDALDRAGLRAPTQAEVTVAAAGPAPWEQIVAGLAPMTQAESRARRGLAAPPAELPAPTPDYTEVVDAEVVQDGPVDRPRWAVDEPADTRRGTGPTKPGNGLMTIEEANAEISRRNRAQW